MTEIDQIRPPTATTPLFKVQRKKRPAKDSNREQRPSRAEPHGEDDRRKHIDETV
jgi:hypothetical protein